MLGSAHPCHLRAPPNPAIRTNSHAVQKPRAPCALSPRFGRRHARLTPARGLACSLRSAHTYRRQTPPCSRCHHVPMSGPTPEPLPPWPNGRAWSPLHPCHRWTAATAAASRPRGPSRLRLRHHCRAAPRCCRLRISALPSSISIFYARVCRTDSVSQRPTIRPVHTLTPGIPGPPSSARQHRRHPLPRAAPRYLLHRLHLPRSQPMLTTTVCA